MRAPRSLQARLALAVGLSVTVLWFAAASVTANRLGHEMEEVFDKDLEATAQRILPLALHDLRKRNDDDSSDDDEEDDDARHIERLDEREEPVTYVVRDLNGKVLLQSRGSDRFQFPPFESVGFSDTKTHRIYSDEARDGRITISVAEPLDHRAEVWRSMLLGLALPLLVVIPFSHGAIAFATRGGLRPERKLKGALDTFGKSKTPLHRRRQPDGTKTKGAKRTLGPVESGELCARRVEKCPVYCDYANVSRDRRQHRREKLDRPARPKRSTF